MKIVMFFIGLIVGGTFGLVIMCFLQASKERETQAKKITKKENKNK